MNIMTTQELAEATLASLGGDHAAAAALLREAAASLAAPPAQSTGPRSNYAVRIMLTRGDSCEADTEPDTAPDSKPAEVVAGMRAITAWVVEVVRAFHASRHDPSPALDPIALDGRLAGLRVSLSRAKGDTWWRVPYQVGEAHWVASVHVVRT